MDQLVKLGDVAGSALRKALQNTSSTEMRVRLTILIEKLTGSVAATEQLPTLRGIEVLERIGGPEARKALEKLAKGPPDDRITLEAKVTLERLGK